MSTQTVSFEAESMPVTMDGFDEALESTQETSEPKKVIRRLRDLKTSARDQLMIDPRIIIIDDGQNPRNYDLPENHAHLDALKRSIRENGTLVPLLVRFDPAREACVLIDGECRLRANLELIAEGVEIEAVPTIQVTGGDDAGRLLTAITANTGKPLSKWELGGAFQRLYNFGWAEVKIATKTGYAERFIREAMELADAPEEIKQLLSSQAVTPSLALAELRANGSAAVQNLQAAAVAAQSSGKTGPAKRAKAPSQPKAQPPAAAAPPVEAVAPPAQDAPAPVATPASNRKQPQASYSLPSEVVKAIMSLIEDVSAEDMNSAEHGAEVVVKLEKLLKLASYAVTEDDLKSIAA